MRRNKQIKRNKKTTTTKNKKKQRNKQTTTTTTTSKHKNMKSLEEEKKVKTNCSGKKPKQCQIDRLAGGLNKYSRKKKMECGDIGGGKR